MSDVPAMAVTARTDTNPVMRPLYSFAEADRLAEVSRGTARRWLVGYAYDTRGGGWPAQPPVTSLTRDEGAVSFLDLVEVVAVGRLKDVGFSLPAIRQVVRNCQEILGVERPLTRLRFRTSGRDIFVDRGGELLEVGRRRGQIAWKEALEPFLRDLDYSDDVARRWWPLGHESVVVVDPEYGYGLPVVARSGVRTEIIRERFEASDSVAQIAVDFNLDPSEVERALQFEVKLAS